MKLIKRITAMLGGFLYVIKAVISFERAIAEIKKRRWFSYKGLKKGELFTLNPWIEYIAIHSTLNYASAIDLYDKCTGLPWKWTRRRAKLLTKLIIDQANCGVTGTAIDVGRIAALIECVETKKGDKTQNE